MTDAAFKKTNYHAHTTFCDGKASAEEMVKAAVRKNFDTAGFSGHSMYPFSSEWHIPVQNHAAYCTEIRRLAAAYAGKIEILLGFEADFIPGMSAPVPEHYKDFKPDYLIGSVHFIITENGWFCADGSPDEITAGIKKEFRGSSKRAVQTYFDLQRQMLRGGGFTFWAHPDLIRKQNGVLHLFDENDGWYVRELKATAKEASRAGICAEINTGAISRGYGCGLYPSARFLSILHESGVPVTINSDAHTPDALDCAFDQAALAAKKAGYTEMMFLHAGSLLSQKLPV